MFSLLLVVCTAEFDVSYESMSPEGVEGISITAFQTSYSSNLFYFSGRVGPYRFLQDMQYFEIFESYPGVFSSFANIEYPDPRAYYASATYNFQYYLFGGLGKKGIYSDCWIFDLNNSIWREVSVSPALTSRFNHASAFFGYDKDITVALFGGTSADSQGIDKLEFVTFSYEKTPELKSKSSENSFIDTCFEYGLTGLQMQYYEDYLYVFSGVYIDNDGNSFYYNGMCRFDLYSYSWMSVNLSSFLPNSSYGGSYINGSSLYYFFGKNDDYYLKNVYKFSFDDMYQGWKEFITNNHGCERASFALTGYINSFIPYSYEPCVFFFGGSSQTLYLNSFGILNARSDDDFEIKCYDMSVFPSPRNNARMCQLSDEIVLFGGKNRESCNNQLWKLRSDMISDWSYISAEGNYPLPRHSHSIACQGNYMVISGGIDDENELLSDFWLLEREGENSYIWTELTTSTSVSPPPTSDSCLVFDFPFVYQIGGTIQSGLSNKIWAYDIITKTFNILETDQDLEPISGHGCVLRKKDNSTFIDVFFGHNSSIYRSNNHITTIKIINKSQIIITRSTSIEGVNPIAYFGYAADKTNLFIAGGINQDLSSFGDFLMIDLESLNSSYLYNTDPFYSSASTIFNTSFILYSGIEGNSYSPDTVSSSYNYFVILKNCSKGFERINMTCTACNPGTYKSDLDNKCHPCEPGTFNIFSGATDKIQCIPCEFGTYNPHPGAKECKNCSETENCFVGSTEPTSYQKTLSNTQPDLIEPRSGSSFKMILLITFGVVCLFFIVFWFFFLKLRIFLSVSDMFSSYHVEHVEEEIHSAPEDQQKHSYVGGFFTGFTILLIMMSACYYLYTFIELNIEESVELVPSNTLTKKTGLKDEKIFIFIEFQSFRGENCKNVLPLLRQSSEDLQISNDEDIHDRKSNNSYCFFKYSLKKNGYFNSGDFIDFNFNCSTCYTSDITVALEGRAAYRDKKSRIVQSLISDDGNVFIGSQASVFYFGVIPALYQDYLALSKKDHYGYRVTDITSPDEGSKAQPSTIRFFSGINIRISLNLIENGVYITTTRKFDTIEFIGIAVSSIGGLTPLVIFVMKVYEIVYYWIKYRKYNQASSYSVELQRRKNLKENSRFSELTYTEDREAIN